MLQLKHLSFKFEPVDLTPKTVQMKLFLCLIKHHAAKKREQRKDGLCILTPDASWRGPLAFTLYSGGNILTRALTGRLLSHRADLGTAGNIQSLSLM